MPENSTQALANCLDAIEQGSASFKECLAHYPDQHSMLTELLPLALTLRSAPAVKPSLDFRLDARQQLIARLPMRRPRRMTLRAKWATWPGSLKSKWLLAGRAIAILAVFVFLGASTVVASAQSLPNDVLYPVKRAIEQVRLTLAPDDVSSSLLHLSFATERLDEVERLIELDRGTETAEALEDFVNQIQAAALTTTAIHDAEQHAAVMTHLNASLETSESILAQTQVRLPQSAQAAVKRAQNAISSSRLHASSKPSGHPPAASITPFPAPTLTCTATPSPSRKTPDHKPDPTPVDTVPR